LRSNVEYKDIAIELKVTPRINPDGYVTMEIDQKVNDLGGSVNVGGTQSPIITKREAKSFVTAKDQSTIVLGGLIREDRTASESKVPVAGDIPLFGLLFKNRAVAKSRTELIVFIRPTVLRSAEQTASEAERRGRMLKAADELGLQKYTTTNAVPPTAQERHDAKVRALTGAGKE
jgi:general secretion pathway protein D